MKKKIFIIVFFLVVIFVIFYCILGNNKSREKEKNGDSNKNNLTTYENEEEINEIKKKVNATADTEMYQIRVEYDGRKIIQIKPSIQFETALAGALKGSKPEEFEIEEIISNKPDKTGIWITNRSRENMKNIFEEIDLEFLQINEDGYVKIDSNNNNINIIENEKNKEYFEKFKKLIYSENLYIIDFSGTTFLRDDISGIITENPFEEMDENQILETYNDKNMKLIEVTKNMKQKFSNKEIFEEIFLNI